MASSTTTMTINHKAVLVGVPNWISYYLIHLSSTCSQNTRGYPYKSFCYYLELEGRTPLGLEDLLTVFVPSMQSSENAFDMCNVAAAIPA